MTERPTREVVSSIFWVVIALLLFLFAYLMTSRVARVEGWDPGNGYTVGFYVAQTTAQAPTQKPAPVELTVLRINNVVEFDFRGVWAGPDIQRVVFHLHPYPKCEWVNGFGRAGSERIGLSIHPVAGYEYEWSYVDIPDNDSSRVLECRVEDYIHAPTFRQRDFFFSVEDTVGKPSGFLAMPVKLQMNYYEVMSENHFFVDGDGHQIDSRDYTLQPGDFAIFEWTSAQQLGREIYLLVIVGALIALGATALIEAARFWLTALIDRFFPLADNS